MQLMLYAEIVNFKEEPLLNLYMKFLSIRNHSQERISLRRILQRKENI